MKLLIFGIDGGDLEIFKIFEMPFLKSLIKDNYLPEISEDLFGRGWASILTGAHASETRAFYMAPNLDGSHNFSTKFSINQIKDESISPMWDEWENFGEPYLIMNVPTSSPVPLMKNGVIVGSGGGGLNKIEGIPDTLVKDEKTKQFLSDQNYIADIRIPNTELETTDELFEEVNKMERIRTNSFIDLCKQANVQFGFLCNRGTTIIEYLSRYDIEAYKNASDNERLENATFQKLKKHFEELDRHIEDLVKKLNPEEFIICSDHGMSPHEYRGNITPYLLKEKLYFKKKQADTLNYLKSKIKKLVPNKKLKSSLSSFAKKTKEVLDSTDWSKTKAFGNDYISGIYINDKQRFGGPVEDLEIDPTVEELCKKINNDPIFTEKGIQARPYRKSFPNAKYNNELPDILLDGADGIYFDNASNQIFRPNPNYKTIPKDLSQVKHAAFTGDKGSKPFVLFSKGLESKSNNMTIDDLTLVYHVAISRK